MVDIRPSLGRCLSIRGGWQLAQLRFQESEVDGLGEEIGSAEFISAAPRIGRFRSAACCWLLASSSAGLG